jgi:D-aminoacyl-tRNA deacylase
MVDRIEQIKPRSRIIAYRVPAADAARASLRASLLAARGALSHSSRRSAAGRTGMIALLQRVSDARVTVEGATVAAVAKGVLALIAVERGDGEQEADRMAGRLLRFRLFADGQGRMNLDVREARGSLLLVPQFTLAADTARGHRPGFSHAAEPRHGQALFEHLLQRTRLAGVDVASGRFGAHMQVSLTNDGPVTFWLRVPPRARFQPAREP